MQLEFHTEFQKASSTKFTELTLHEYLSLSNPRWQISNRNEAVPKISNELIPMSTVIDQPQFAIHVFVREAEPVFFPHIASRRDQTAIRAGIRTEYGDHIRFPEEGGNVFHRLVHAVEMLFLLHPVRFPARHGQDAHSLQFRRVPDVTAHESGISSVNPHSAICKYP